MAKVYDLFSPKVFAENFGSPVPSGCQPRFQNTSRQYANGVCERLRSALSSLCCESAVVTLTLVSVLAISGEILIDYGILTAPSVHQTEQTTSGESPTPPTPEAPSGSKSGGVDTMEMVKKVFHYISIAVAGLFLIEILLKLAAFRMRFLINPWQVMDMLVVLAVVLVEVAFEVEGRMPELEVCTFVVVFRLWRLPHACNIRAKAVQRDLEQDLEVWRAGKSKLEDKCRTLEARNSKQKEKIERLEREMSVLKNEAKENHRLSKHPSDQASKPNGSVPRDTVDGFTSNHLGANHHVTAAETQAHARRYVTADSEEDDDDTVNGSPRKVGERGEDRETEEDTVEEEEDNEKGKSRSYFRSGSESSLSCQALEQEVCVQIEGQGEQEVEVVVGAPSREESVDSATNTPVRTRRKLRRREDRHAPVTEPVADGGVYYDNEGYNPDLDSGEDEHGELVYEIDGSKTYRSAEGIPMTDL